MRMRIPARLAPLAALLVLVSCGPRTIGQAVVLWGTEDGPANGDVLGVISRSTIQKTTTLWDPQRKQSYELESWRVRDDFRKTAEAASYAELLASWRDTYAFTDRSDGLPVREKPDTQAQRVYKIAPAQLVKVLGRGDSKATEGAFEAYWYDVLTDDGYRGWVFGYFLRIFETEPGRERARMEEILAEDPLLDKLFAREWRPEYFAEMIGNGRIDLHRFRPEIGLFPDRQGSTWKLKLLDLETMLVFDRVENPATGVYTFPPSDLRITVYPGDRLDVSYRRDGRLARTVFVQVVEDVEEVIRRETQRRADLLASFLTMGTRLVSNAYGVVDIRTDGIFWWSGFTRVPTGVFAREVSGRGRLDFPNHLDPKLTSTYAGAVSLVFDEYQPAEETVFLYSYASGGLQLTHVPAANIQDLLVRDVPASPLVMFFVFREP